MFLKTSKINEYLSLSKASLNYLKNTARYIFDQILSRNSINGTVRNSYVFQRQFRMPKSMQYFL